MSVSQTNNLTQSLMQAQEHESLIRRMVYIKASVDNQTPSFFREQTKVPSSVRENKAQRLRKQQIETENEQLLKKLFKINHRRTKNRQEKLPKGKAFSHFISSSKLR